MRNFSQGINPMKLRLLLLTVGAFILAGCSDRRNITLSLTEPLPDFVTYEDNIKPRFDAGCVGCHSGAGAAGSYKLDTYAGVLGNGVSAPPNAIPGDSTSLLITKVKNMTHFAWNTPADQANISLLIRWVVKDSCRQN